MTIRLGLIGAGIMGADHARLFAEEVPEQQFSSFAMRMPCGPEELQRQQVHNTLRLIHWL